MEPNCPRCGAPKGPGTCEQCNDVPNPGSLEAATLGCSCPRIENCHGSGALLLRGDGLDPDERPSFWINPRCMLHGDWRLTAGPAVSGGGGLQPTPGTNNGDLGDGEQRVPGETALTALDAEQFIDDLFRPAATCSELVGRTYTWTVEQHAAHVWWADDSGDMTGIDPGQEVEATYDNDPRFIASDFHLEAVRLLRQRSVTTLFELGPLALVASTVAERIKSRYGQLTPQRGQAQASRRGTRNMGFRSRPRP